MPMDGSPFTRKRKISSSCWQLKRVLVWHKVVILQINRQWLWNRGDASKESERTEVIQLPDNGSCSILIACVLTLQILRHRNELGQITNPQPIHRDILLLIMFRLRGYLCGKLSNRKNFGIF